MTSKNEDFRSFDWDDSALIKAYNKGTKLREKALQKTKYQKKGNSSKDNVKAEDEWKVGDYCRAEYSADQSLYEAKILSINNDGCCTVEFLGYGNKETVDLTDLLESCGKKARRRQNKTALGGYSTASESCLNTTDGECESRRSYSASKHLNDTQVSNAVPYDYSVAEGVCQVPHQSHTNPLHAAVGHPHLPACYAPACSVPSNVPFLPVPPAPPMPQCPSVAQNPSLSGMLISWYMAGYYTGLHQGQKDSQCPQRCCGRVSRCCH